ncbi:MAG TPA: class I SAM-dependent methyltransferase [Candidatus Methanoculleus thermohydrogenotrophicum]|jgi:ubiquinone/menaquinone biosynthesis C-methylase UbiE|nr:class I SAM-dependent methyltransferase [Candidatus Methanoculleus thermohydrogenotrophicum]NLM82842.1 class I SAM-dependent methyltransferase [Candidatus Methanoculleus thermohydrogenotrophicum]HOB18760.1 class I SAM-dependent methyltransferase [Candidatus Methanoculleus thermohydrogenotrophicum]HPZ38808.1 class I SAM-dependent methyltransferase [Candidatus Methanoculleus thermohydrogenotrophicum]HQC91963.1 class I SAM-dependent methyltransferase [Candidatus Methanoculleus thermohydrogenotr
MKKKSAEGFTRIAREVFAPIYPVIAEQVLAWSGIQDGLCLDLGSGPGLLSVALAEKSNLSVIALDADPAMAPIAQETAIANGLADRVAPVIGDVHWMPVRDATTSLIVSRGSIFFWKDRVQVFREIERVLRPGGAAYVGGSFGTAALRDEIFAEMRRRNPNWDRDIARRSRMATPDTLRRELAASGVASSRIREEEAGFWVEIRKD